MPNTHRVSMGYNVLECQCVSERKKGSVQTVKPIVNQEWSLFCVGN